MAFSALATAMAPLGHGGWSHWRSPCTRCCRLSAHAQVTGRHAVLVIDANTGRVLHQSSADELRFPASLAKMMTLYMVFELIEQGRLSYRTKIRFSANAAAAAPSKLDLEEGEEIALIDAIKALITKIANDVAVAVAEHIAGSEERFAQTDDAEGAPARHDGHEFPQCLGPARSRAGDDRARHDHAGAAAAGRLPAALSAVRHPHLHLQGDTFRNHNTLLFSYQGTDGMKTGYTRASGFNLVASVRRGRKHVVAVVFGGATAASRNAAMRTYLNMGLVKASNEKTRKPAPRLVAQAKVAPPRMAVAPPAPQPAQRPAPRRSAGGRDRARAPGARAWRRKSPPDSIEALLARPSLMQVPPPALTAPPTALPAATAAGAFQSRSAPSRARPRPSGSWRRSASAPGAVLSNHSAVTTRQAGRQGSLSRALRRLRGASDGGQRLHRAQAPEHRLPRDDGGVNSLCPLCRCKRRGRRSAGRG